MLRELSSRVVKCWHGVFCGAYPLAEKSKEQSTFGSPYFVTLTKKAEPPWMRNPHRVLAGPTNPHAARWQTGGPMAQLVWVRGSLNQLGRTVHLLSPEWMFLKFRDLFGLASVCFPFKSYPTLKRKLTIRQTFVARKITRRIPFSIESEANKACATTFSLTLLGLGIHMNYVRTVVLSGKLGGVELESLHSCNLYMTKGTCRGYTHRVCEGYTKGV